MTLCALGVNLCDLRGFNIILTAKILQRFRKAHQGLYQFESQDSPHGMVEFKLVYNEGKSCYTNVT
jgi:hypothetical protein